MAEGWLGKYGEKSIASSLVLASGFALLLALETGAHVVLSLTDFLLDAGLLDAPLEPLECAFQRFVLFDANFRH